MKESGRPYDLAACVLIAVTSGALGIWLMPRIGHHYPATALLDFILYLARQPGFWVAGLIASALGLIRNREARIQVHTRNDLLVLGLAWLMLTLSLINANIGLWRLPADAMAGAALILMFPLTASSPPFSREGIEKLVRVGLVAGLFMVLFSMLALWHTVGKSWIFLVADGRDALLETADAAVLGGDFYTRLQRWRQAHTGAVQVADWIYVAFMQQFLWAGFYFAFIGSAGVKSARIWSLSVFLAYFLGTLGYFVLPAYGPAFARPELFSDLQSSQLVVDEIQAMLAGNTSRVQAGPVDVIPIFGFIAAMPSLHVGVTVLAALCTTGLMRIICWLWAIATWLCTIVLGWHWMWDGPAGILLAIVCWAIASGVVERSMKTGRSELPA